MDAMPSDATVFYTRVPSPFGALLIAGTAAGLTHLNFQQGDHPLAPDPLWMEDDSPLREAARQVRAYFAGELRDFSLPLAPEGTPFQRTVWRALCAIPYGRTISYGDLARRVGKPGAARAVGAANGRNPLPVVVPCHRVIGADGGLTGYGEGLPIKAGLLELERRVAAQATLFR
jgi:methylated-DNA-[protein]-cysteine S-methyltransferase